MNDEQIKLCRKLRVIGNGGGATMSTGDKEPHYFGTVNPDGPAAAREIERLVKENERLVNLLWKQGWAA